MSGLVVTRAGAGASTGVHDADPIRTEVVRHGLDSAANQMKRALVRTAFSPIVYEVLDFAVALYDRDVRMLAQAPSLPLFMGRLSFCVENAVAAIGGEGVLEPGDVILFNHPVRHRLASAGRGARAAGLPPRRGARRLRRREGALARHRRQGAVRDGHGRHVPGGNDLPGREARQPRQDRPGHLSPRARELARAEGGGGRHQRGARLRAHGRNGDAARDRALRAGGLPRMRRADVRSRRVGRALVVRPDPGRTLRRPRHARQRRYRRRADRVRRRGRGRGLVGDDRLPRRARRAPRSRELLAAEDRLGDADRDHDARRRRRVAERRALPADRGDHASRLALPSAAAGTDVHRRLGGARRGRRDLPRARERRAGQRARFERRRHLLPRVVGPPRGDRRALGGRVAASGRPGSIPPRRRRERGHARLAVGDAHRADGGLGEPEPVADRTRRARAGLGRRGQASRRQRPRHGLPPARGRRDHRGDRPDAHAAGRARRAAAKRARTAPSSRSRTARRSPARRRRGSPCPGERSSSFEPVAAAATARRRSVPSRRCTADLREGYVSEERARADYPHAFTPRS